MSASRTIEKVVPATHGKINRLIGTVDMDGNGTNHPLPEVDPFILLDHGIVKKNHSPPFGSHPHRGHSVVTILMNGQFTSWDSFKKDRSETETIQAPASYWVDAGSGVFHDERSVIEDENDPTQHGKVFQLWIGVKEEDRQKPPRVQIDNDLKPIELENGAGTAVYYVGGASPKIETPHPIAVAHVKQTKNTTYRHAIPSGHGGFVVHMNGKPSFAGTTPDQEEDVLVLNNCGDSNYLEITTTAENDAEYLVCTGEPHGEKWVKKLVANGAVIAANEEDARGLVDKVEAMSKAGKEEGGSFAPFGI